MRCLLWGYTNHQARGEIGAMWSKQKQTIRPDPLLTHTHTYTLANASTKIPDAFSTIISFLYIWLFNPPYLILYKTENLCPYKIGKMGGYTLLKNLGYISKMVKNSSKCSERDLVSRLCELDTLDSPKKEMVDPATRSASAKCDDIRACNAGVHSSVAWSNFKAFRTKPSFPAAPKVFVWSYVVENPTSRSVWPASWARHSKDVRATPKRRQVRPSSASWWKQWMNWQRWTYLHGPWQGWTLYFVHTPVFYFVVRATPLASILLFHKCFFWIK